MVAFLNDLVLDAAIQELISNVNSLHICSQQPTTYTEATSTYTLGNKASPSLGAVQDGATSGRRTVVSAITDGSVSGTGTATHFALVDTVGSTLYATQALSSSQAVTSGNTFTLTSFSVTVPDPTA